jgi:Cys-tRNA(Pro)/Cys-tRNA(Cys) deacylase
MATQRDAERVTGLQVGGISALALLNKGFAVYIEHAALAHESILVSAGQRGWDVKLRVADLLSITNAKPIAAAKR